MGKKIRVLYDGKVFYPEEAVELEPNTHYTAIIEKDEVAVHNQAFRRILERAADLGIIDLARQHDHYLYGTEKS